MNIELADASIVVGVAFILAGDATIALVAVAASIHLGRRLYRHARSRRDARLNRHVQAAIDARLVQPLEADTVILPPLSPDETRFFAHYERQMQPLADLYIFDDRRPARRSR